MKPDGTPPDLGRINEALSRIERAVRDNPEIGERTAAALAGELPMEASMADKQTGIRVPEEWLERADALVPKVAADPKYEAFGKVKRATVLRMAIGAGLRVIELEYAKGGE